MPNIILLTIGILFILAILYIIVLYTLAIIEAIKLKRKGGKDATKIL